MMTDATARYTPVAIALHWIVAALVFGNIVLAWSFDAWPDRYQMQASNTHKSIGIVVFGFALMRILWRCTHQPPVYPTTVRAFEVRLARLVHALLYALIVVMPLSGWLYDSAWKDGPANPIRFFGLFNFPRLAYIVQQDERGKDYFDKLFGTMHHVGAYAIYVLVLLHITGVLKHQFLDKARVLQRMRPSGPD